MITGAQSILVIHIAGLARTTLALPALRSLRQHFPQSRITVVSGATATELLRLAQCADEVLPVGRFRHGEIVAPGKFYRSTKSLGALRRLYFDLAIPFHSGAETEILLQFAQPQARLDKEKTLPQGIQAVLERVSKALSPHSAVRPHLAHEYLRKLEPLGVRPLEAEPRLSTDRAADEHLEKFLQKHGVAFGELLVGIHPGAGLKQNVWPQARFASLAARLIHNFNARVLVFAGPHERGQAKRLVSALPAKRALAFEAPKLPDLISAFARLSLLVANHSGPAHVAAAVGTPVVVISPHPQATAEDVLGPRCEHVRGAHIELISEEAVYEAACRLLKINRAEFLRSR